VSALLRQYRALVGILRRLKALEDFSDVMVWPALLTAKDGVCEAIGVLQARIEAAHPTAALVWPRDPAMLPTFPASFRVPGRRKSVRRKMSGGRQTVRQGGRPVRKGSSRGKTGTGAAGVKGKGGLS
jgi:hypothetical protein